MVIGRLPRCNIQTTNYDLKFLFSYLSSCQSVALSVYVFSFYAVYSENGSKDNLM
jgi:hypothetical protein